MKPVAIAIAAIIGDVAEGVVDPSTDAILRIIATGAVKYNEWVEKCKIVGDYVEYIINDLTESRLQISNDNKSAAYSVYWMMYERDFVEEMNVNNTLKICAYASAHFGMSCVFEASTPTADTPTVPATIPTTIPTTNPTTNPTLIVAGTVSAAPTIDDKLAKGDFLPPIDKLNKLLRTVGIKEIGSSISYNELKALMNNWLYKGTDSTLPLRIRLFGYVSLDNDVTLKAARFLMDYLPLLQQRIPIVHPAIMNCSPDVSNVGKYENIGNYDPICKIIYPTLSNAQIESKMLAVLQARHIVDRTTTLTYPIYDLTTDRCLNHMFDNGYVNMYAVAELAYRSKNDIIKGNAQFTLQDIMHFIWHYTHLRRQGVYASIR
jgi:hypothetical protein